MTAWAVHVAAGRDAPETPVAPEKAHVVAALALIPDPELPIVSIADLGMIHRVDVTTDGIHVTVLPTFIGCPALDVIRSSIVGGLSGFGLPVTVETSLVVPWTSDRITATGRSALAGVGIAPPAALADVHCPWCSSAAVVMDSAFGPTQCRSLFYCRTCRQPFEAMKQV